MPTGEAAADDDVDPAAAATLHRQQAVEANNATWGLLDGRRHDDDEAAELLERAHTAAHHWRRAAPSGAINHARAAWLVSRAHATLGHGELALWHAHRCQRLTAESGDDAADFDRAYVHEARARALAALGRADEARAARAAARSIEIADLDDRSIIEGDLAAEPWFGLTD